VPIVKNILLSFSDVVSFCFGFGAVEQAIDVLLSHKIFFDGFTCCLLLAINGLIKFSGTVFPKSVAVDRA
jgi:hypothetical protein